MRFLLIVMMVMCSLGHCLSQSAFLDSTEAQHILLNFERNSCYTHQDTFKEISWNFPVLENLTPIDSAVQIALKKMSKKRKWDFSAEGQLYYYSHQCRTCENCFAYVQSWEYSALYIISIDEINPSINRSPRLAGITWGCESSGSYNSVSLKPKEYNVYGRFSEMSQKGDSITGYIEGEMTTLKESIVRFENGQWQDSLIRDTTTYRWDNR